MQAEFRSLAVGVFDRGDQAEHCVEELRQAGFAADQIGIIEPDADATLGTPADQPPAGQGASAGVRQMGTAGAVIGGLLGAATALVIPGIGPVVAGGVLASALGGAAVGVTLVLAGFGIPRQQAVFYEHELAQGRTLVTVDAAERYREALDVLRACGGRSVDLTDTNFGAGTERTAAPSHPDEQEEPRQQSSTD